MSVQLPPPPSLQGPEPPRRGRAGPVLVAVGVIVLLGVVGYLGAGSGGSVDDTVPLQSPLVSDEEMASIVADEVIADDPERFATVCEGYHILGYEESFASFVEGYGAMRHPSAELVYDELISRC